MMTRFDILSTKTLVYSNHALEASAGTGKTFAIEHLVVRLLIEEDPSLDCGPCVLSQILVITFTRAATRELRERIRANISKTLALLQRKIQSDEHVPEYVSAIISKGERECKQAQRRLRAALADFDEAQIVTIHGFCARALKNYSAVSPPTTRSDDVDVPYEVLYQVVRDVLRSELTPDQVSVAQLELLFRSYRYDQEALLRSLMSQVLRGVKISAPLAFGEQFELFRDVLERLKVKKSWDPQKIVEDFERQYPCYKKWQDLDPDSLRKAIEDFSLLFEKENYSTEDLETQIRQGLVFVRALDPQRQKKRGPKLPEDLHYPCLWKSLHDQLLPLIEEARDPHSIFAMLAQKCQHRAELFLKQEEIEGPDQLLGRMAEAVEDAGFRREIQQALRFAVVDEFQDTDPLQWKILRALFVDSSAERYLALVGDPKQAIYAFRRADIYTYIDACRELPNANRGSLSVNYRSQPTLVQGVNQLFDSEGSPGLLDMPRDRSSLLCVPVEPGISKADRELMDGLGSIHFMMTRGQRGRSRRFPTANIEQGTQLPYIVSEIGRLIDDEERCYQDFAILVRDRFQASSVAEFLAKYGIPVALERSGYLTDRPTYASYAELMNGFLNPRNTSALAQALGGTLVGWNHQQLREWENEEVPETIKRAIMQQIYFLRTLLLEGSVIRFTEEFLRSQWHADGKSVAERLLSQNDGHHILQDTIQISDVLAHIVSKTHARAEGLLTALTDLEIMAASDDERVRVKTDPSEDAVRVMTMHVSKGLEFDIVFALGLCKRSQVKERLFHHRQKDLLVPIVEGEDTNLCEYREELDAEKVRQAYVAMTRAKSRLYVPLAIEAEGAKLEIGQAAPIELLVARFNQPLTDVQGVYQRIRELSERPLIEFIEQQPKEVFTYCELVEGEYQPKKRPDPKPPTLDTPVVIERDFTQSYLHSFTSLNTAQYHHSDFGEYSPPHDLKAQNKTVHTLPAGAEIGILIHHLLEILPFEIALKDQAIEAIHAAILPELTQKGFQDWSSVISEMILRVLKTPLPLGDQNVALCHIPEIQQYHELEFLYSQENDFVKGYIDLVFHFENRYYIVDYKCNWLGPSDHAYHPQKLHQAMLEHGYPLQASLYSEALQRYIKTKNHFEQKKLFGGCFYLFLRGIREESSYGIYQCQTEGKVSCVE